MTVNRRFSFILILLFATSAYAQENIVSYNNESLAILNNELRGNRDETNKARQDVLTLSATINASLGNYVYKPTSPNANDSLYYNGTEWTNGTNVYLSYSTPYSYVTVAEGEATASNISISKTITSGHAVFVMASGYTTSTPVSRQVTLRYNGTQLAITNNLVNDTYWMLQGTVAGLSGLNYFNLTTVGAVTIAGKITVIEF